MYVHRRSVGEQKVGATPRAVSTILVRGVLMYCMAARPQ